MSFSKLDLEKIKNKITLSTEIQKRTKLIKKGKDYWCCCIFHKEKTPSFKINDDQGSFYCFGCGAKGDIFTLYKDLYNYNFQDAVKELAQKTGIQIKFSDIKVDKALNKINEILNLSADWFNNNLKNPEAKSCNEYIQSRKLLETTVEKFKLGYSYNKKQSLYDYLKEKSFAEEDIIKSNVVKIDKKNNIKDYFYKRLIFPIKDLNGKIVGFGGRSLDNSNPKYINSPESVFFHKRNVMYNLSEAKNTARKKNNLLICEGYMDVISLSQHGINSVVAPLGTSLTEEQINLAWKFSSKPTIMFDSDKAGLRAAFKSALMSLPLITSNKFLQFITLDEGYDPDSYLNNHSFENFLKIIKKPINLVNFIFNESSKAFSLKDADSKILFDKYLDDIINSIKDPKIKYFYKNEFKSLFFEKLKTKKSKQSSPKKISSSLNTKQKLSFIAGFLNHESERNNIVAELIKSELFEDQYMSLLYELKKPELIKLSKEKISQKITNPQFLEIINDSLNPAIYQLFSYASPKYNPQNAYSEIKESCINLNTRLSNLKKINKSLDSFVKESSQLNWEELQNINIEIFDDS